MTWEELRGSWRLLQTKVQQQWDKLANEDMDFIHGRRSQLSERLCERYGFTKQAIERWHARLNGVNA